MNIKKELLIKQAQEGYTVCYVENCPLRNHCLRWLVGQHMPPTASTYRCVNPNYQHVATSDCPMYRKDEKVRFAKGMKNMFNDDMPKSVQNAVKYGVINKSNRTYYYEYKNGSRLIPPALQEHIRKLFRDKGWTAKVDFDSYVDDYNW